MTRTAGRLDNYMLRYVSRILAVETHLREQPPHVGSKSVGIGIEFAGLCSQFVLVERCAGFEAVVPHIIWAEFASQPLADDRRYGFDLGRTDQRAEQTVKLGGGNLHTFLKVPLDARRCSRTVFVFLKQRVGYCQNALVAGVRLGGILTAVWLPDEVGVVDCLLRYILTDYTLHDLVDHLLLLLTGLFVTVQSLELIAQVPVTEQNLILRPQLPTIVGAQIAHVDVVIGYVVLGIGISLRQCCIDSRRYACGKHVAHASHCPLLASPRLAQCVLLLQGEVREVQYAYKSQTVGKHIVGEMCQRTISRHNPIRCLRLGSIGQLRGLE